MKRTFIRLILSFFLLLPLATTAQTYESVPYFTSFEGLLYQYLPTEWENYETYNNYPRVSMGVLTHSGEASLYMQHSGGTNITATCPFDSLPWLKIEFYAYSASLPATFEVGVMEDSTFVPVDTIDIIASTPQAPIFARYRAYFDTYNGTGSRIAFRTQGTSRYSMLIDDVTIDVAPTCRAEPGEPEVTPTATDVTMQWAPASSSSWYGISLNDSIYVSYDTSITITGLTPDTPYSGYLFNTCPAGDISELVEFSFRTSCAPISNLPYLQSFETESVTNIMDTNSFSFCWYRFCDENTTSYANYPWVNSSTSANHTAGGSKGLRWYNPTTSDNRLGTYRCIASPPIDSSIDVSTTKVTFWAHFNDIVFADPEIIIGMMAVPGDISTFDPVDTVTITGSRWWKYEVLFSNYTGNGNHVAFLAYSSPEVWDMYLDDITIDYIPSCSHLDNISLDPTVRQGGSYLALTWDSTGAVSYEVQYGVEGFELGTGTSITTLNNSISIPGLNNLTSYDVYVRQVCAVGDTSEWIMGAFATVMCDNSNTTHVGDSSLTSNGYDIPVDFSAKYSLCETIIDSTTLGGPQVISAISLYHHYSQPATSKTNCTIYMQPYRPIDPGFHSIDYDLSSLLPLDTDAVCVYTGSLNGVYGWNTFTFDTPYTYNGNGHILMIVDDNSNGYDGTAYGYVTTIARLRSTVTAYSQTDDIDPTNLSSYTGYPTASARIPFMKVISCGGQFCVSPIITSVTTSYDGATITWEGNSDTYEISCLTPGDYDFPPETTVTGNSYTYTGLTPETYYYFRIRQHCSDDSSNYSEWTYHYVITEPYPCYTPSDIDISNITKVNASISWAVNGRESDWHVHVWADTLYDRIDTCTTNSLFIDSLTPGVTYNVAVRALCGRYLREGEWSDTVAFTTRLCPDVTGFIADEITNTTISLSWDDNPLAESWELIYDTAGTNENYDTIRLTTNRYTLTGLTPGGIYHLYIRAICDADLPSDNWTHAYAVTNNTQHILMAEDDDAIAAYPNPCSDHVSLYAPIEEIINVTLYDMAGRQVPCPAKDITQQSGTADHAPCYTLDTSTLPQGSYILSVQTRTAQHRLKLVKK